MNVLGYISIYASTIYAATLILGATCSIGSDSAFVATKYQNYGMFAATTFLTFAMTCVSSEALNKLNMCYIFIQFGMLLALIIALAAGTPSELKNSASFVFADFENTSYGWNNGWAFMLSFLTPVWVVSGFESSATIAEEASNAARAVPFAMLSSLVTATVTGWAVIITIAFCMGTDVIGIVTSPLGQPLAQIAFNSLGKNGSIAILVFLWFSSICNCSILMVAASRETFAFARGMLDLSSTRGGQSTDKATQITVSPAAVFSGFCPPTKHPHEPLDLLPFARWLRVSLCSSTPSQSTQSSTSPSWASTSRTACHSSLASSTDILHLVCGTWATGYHTFPPSTQ
jgi:amino acid transporter